jgi:hypothetical protein
MQTYFFLASYGVKSQVLVLVIVKKTRELGSRKQFIPDPDPGGSRIQGVKKHQFPDPDP